MLKNPGMLKKRSTFIARITACLVMLTASFAGAAQDRFIDGFPDIPYLDIVLAVMGEPVIFDTASGTVAEVGIQFSEPAPAVFAAYSKALVGLGWNCAATASNLRCTREDSLIQLTAPEGNGAADTFILRLEPQ